MNRRDLPSAESLREKARVARARLTAERAIRADEERTRAEDRNREKIESALSEISGSLIAAADAGLASWSFRGDRAGAGDYSVSELEAIAARLRESGFEADVKTSGSRDSLDGDSDLDIIREHRVLEIRWEAEPS